jgi:molybdenum cofactor cytidylyltransferase
VGFATGLRDELLALDGDQGARSLIERHPDALRLIECEDAGVLYDIDRKTDIQT